MVCVKAELTTFSSPGSCLGPPRLPETESKRPKTFLLANARKAQSDCNAVTTRVL